jgi:hypothetical protein
MVEVKVGRSELRNNFIMTVVLMQRYESEEGMLDL